jgi:hypothetical protein
MRRKPKGEIDKIDAKIDEIDGQHHKSTIFRCFVEKTSKEREMPLFSALSKC